MIKWMTSVLFGAIQIRCSAGKAVTNSNMFHDRIYPAASLE